MTIERSVRINVKTGNARNELNQLSRSLGQTERASNLLRNSIAGLAAGVSFGQIVGQLTRFEDEMAGVRAVSGATEKQFASLEKQARQLGATTTFGAEQAAGAQRFLAQAGFEVNEILSATPGILQLAKAGQLELAEAADISSNVLSGLGLEVSRLNDLNDVLAATANRSNTNIQQLGQAFSFAASFARNAGISMEQASAAIGVLGDNGVQATRAGTGLVGVIRELSKFTPQAEAALAKYGLTARDVDISTVGLQKALDTLRKANISSADSFTIFGTEAANAANILIGSSDRLAEFTGELQNVEGEASRVAGIMGDTLGSSIKGLTSALSEAVLQAGDGGLGGTLRELTVVAAGVVQSFNGLSDEFAEANGLTEQQTANIEAATVAVQALAVVYGSRLAGSFADVIKARVADIAAANAQDKANREAAANATALAAANAKAAEIAAANIVKETQVQIQSTAAKLNDIKAVQAQLVADRELEVVRLQAQINDIGRTKSLTRLAEIRRAESAITVQATAAEKAHSTAVAQSSAAYNAYTVASRNATAATATHTAAVKSTTLAARAGTIAVNGLKSALALLGGPAGIAIAAGSALLFYGNKAKDAERDTDDLSQSVTRLGENLDEVSRKQAAVRLLDLEQDIEDIRTEQAEVDKLIDLYNRAAGTSIRNAAGEIVDTVDTTDSLTRALGRQENITNELNRALELQGRLQSIVNGTYKTGSDDADDNTGGIIDQVSAYQRLKGELDAVTRIQNRYAETVKEINKEVTDSAQRTELLALAERERDKALELLEKRSSSLSGRNKVLRKSYVDLLGVFDPAVNVANRYTETIKEIDKSTASDTQKQQLRRLAQQRLNEELANAVTTTREFAASYNPLIAAEIQRDHALKELDKTQGSLNEKQAVAIEINKQYAEAVAESRRQQMLNAETERSYFGAFKQGLEESATTAESSYDMIREVGRNSIDDLSSSLANFIATGEGDFRSFAAGIIQELLRVQTQALLTQAAMALLGIGGGAQNVGSAASSLGYSTTGYAGAFGFSRGGVVEKYAKGGLPGIGQFSNSVVSTPTMFAAGGKRNQMGEAGAEAILPLQRTAGGELGVKADTGQSQAAPNVMVDVPVRVVNVAQDPQDWANSPAGERVIVNIMNRNRGALQ